MLFAGRHFVPVRNLNIPISDMAGIPFAKRKRQMRMTAIIEKQAVRRKTYFIAVSLNFFIQELSFRFYLKTAKGLRLFAPNLSAAAVLFYLIPSCYLFGVDVFYSIFCNVVQCVFIVYDNCDTVKSNNMSFEAFLKLAVFDFT